MSTSKIKASMVAAVIAGAGLLAAPPSADACWLWTYATGWGYSGVAWGHSQTELDFGCYEEGYYDGVSACRFSAGRDPGFSKPFPPDLFTRLRAL